MESSVTKQRILKQALFLFSKAGYDAVSVEQIAAAVGIKAPSLYKHFKSKRDIFNGILQIMEQRDRDNAAVCSLPEETIDADPQAYERSSIDDLLDFTSLQFAYWTRSEFACAFRRMLTVEQYRSEEMNRLYHQYLGAGPLAYTADLLGSQEEALELYGPIHLLYSIYDQTQDKEATLALLNNHLKRWRK